jgi:hypothetical protein
MLPAMKSLKPAFVMKAFRTKTQMVLAWLIAVDFLVARASAQLLAALLAAIVMQASLVSRVMSVPRAFLEQPVKVAPQALLARPARPAIRVSLAPAALPAPPVKTEEPVMKA